MLGETQQVAGGFGQRKPGGSFSGGGGANAAKGQDDMTHGPDE